MKENYKDRDRNKNLEEWKKQKKKKSTWVKNKINKRTIW